MPSARKKDTKLAGAYIPDEKDKELARIAEELGYPDKASYIRALFDEAIASQSPKLENTSAKGKRAKKAE